jgi:hypothetical protein
MCPERTPKAASRLAHVERNIGIGRKLVALRDKTPNNREFGRLRCQQFDVDTLPPAK